MDISDSYEPQQPQQIDPQQQQQQQQQQHLQMQCEATTYTNGFAPATAATEPPHFGPMLPTDGVSPFGPHMPLELPVQMAIPLPAPPPSKAQLAAPPSLAIQAPPPTSTDIDIDSLLLQQFSCLGTTDHEDLINQFQSLMNNQMNKDSARFFLEMSNWNLQTAVGCYLDFCNFQTLPSMKIVQQSRPSEYQQAWQLQNDGTEDWPNGCYLMSPSQTRRIEVPAIKSGSTCDILADIPPTQPAIMWRLCTPNGWYFGETIWMIPPGTCNTQAELAERMSQLRTSSNSTNPESFPQVNIVISVNME